jgi:hypothetical protein
MTVSVVLLLVSVTDWTALLVLTAWLPNASVAGVTFITDGCAMPVPVTGNVCAR